MAESRDYYARQLDGGTVQISEEVVAAIAAAAIVEVDGVAGLNATFSTELQELLSKKNLYKGVRLTMEADSITVDCSIIVRYGETVPSVAEAVQDAVRQAVESMVGLQVATVNVNVAGISMTKRD